MAIDSAVKRRQVAHVARMWSGGGVTPTGSPGSEWRRGVARNYNNVPVPAGTYSYTATGGITFGGAADVTLYQVLRQVEASGGIVFGGAGLYSNSAILNGIFVHGRLPCGRLGALRQAR